MRSTRLNGPRSGKYWVPPALSSALFLVPASFCSASMPFWPRFLIGFLLAKGSRISSPEPRAIFVTNLSIATLLLIMFPNCFHQKQLLLLFYAFIEIFICLSVTYNARVLILLHYFSPTTM